MATLYVNKPGGVIVHLKDGTAENLAYGERVDSKGELADYVDTSKFADDRPRRAPDQLQIDANTRAALTEDGQVNSSSSAVPGNYRELEADAAARLVSRLERYPNAQAEVILHEIVVNNGGRQEVLDAASEYAVVTANAKIEAARDEGVEEPTNPGSAPVLTGDVGDPQIRPGDPDHSARIAERALRLSGKGGKGRTPEPRATQRSDLAAREDGLSEEEREQVEARRGDDVDGGDAQSFEDGTKSQLHAYADQHGVEVNKSDSKEELIEKLQAAGHDSPQTPLPEA